jgi:hypothetical protein
MMTQIRDNKSSSITQTRRLRRNGDLYFKSGKDACISSKLWDIGQQVLQISPEKSLTRSFKRKATLRGPSLKLFLEIFHLWEIDVDQPKNTSKDPLHVPNGPMTRSKTKALKRHWMHWFWMFQPSQNWKVH